MVIKNCATCGTTNELDATACMVCAGATFLTPHTPVGDADGPLPSKTAAPEVVVVVVEPAFEAPSVPVVASVE